MRLIKLLSASTLLLFAATVLVLFASPAAAQEGLQGGGDAQVTNSWIVTQACGGCGPTESFEVFIVNDTGAGPFDSPGLSTLPAGWAGSDVTPNYALATGPSVNLSGWTEHYQGNITDSVRINYIMWTGAPLTSTIAFAAAFTRRVDGTIDFSDNFCQSFGQGCPQMQDPDGIDYDRGTIYTCIDPFDPPFDAPLTLKAKKNGAIPVKMQLFDVDGFLVTDADLAALPVVNVSFAPSNGDPSEDVTDDLLPTGQANDDNIFRFDIDEDKFIYNLSSKPYKASGEYTVTAVSGDPSYAIEGCSQTFTRQ